MRGIHQYISFLLASIIFLFSFTIKFIFDIISINYFIRDCISFLVIYWVCKLILSKVEMVFVLTKKVSGE
ncbi:hypothetical protein Calni_0929 [Calditerrivibrio nitroreducens DSM 19672]|uniref:Uncharacterized protein n=1 Tax=Calditerrivibrio nitroreducens (strain DSM 19672 / NBRC 101217 / Yu37-1) TaxID=768670 RepID=E4THL5_CALNY|nr:hypothetical protein Calni_0929 [Calditerrivibrio nitroreducens DSM 19672]